MPLVFDDVIYSDCMSFSFVLPLLNFFHLDQSMCFVFIDPGFISNTETCHKNPYNSCSSIRFLKISGYDCLFPPFYTGKQVVISCCFPEQDSPFKMESTL